MELLCEYCGNPHDGSYGSGRFCCQSCSRKYSSIINNKSRITSISSSMNKYYSSDRFIRKDDEVEAICKVCGKKFLRSRRSKRSTCSKECLSELKSSKCIFGKLTYEQSSEMHKRSYALGLNYVSGGTTRWYTYEPRGIKVQGSYELRVCRILDYKLSLGLISDWEYTKDRISYTWEDGSTHSYLLNFKVIDNSGGIYYIESKGYVRPYDYEKWESAKDLGLELLVWFLEDIINEEREVWD